MIKKKKPAEKKDERVTITITGKNSEAINQFLVWMTESGEQEYWNWMECRESETAGDITFVDFDYDFKKKTVRCKLGRIDENE